ncbi:MAG: hypothetical protein IJQ50_03255 [Clostridia bacterium]|nr:hypothetical protein [Clostridia bacterium]
MAEGHRRRMLEKIFKHGIDILYEHEFLEVYLYAIYARRNTTDIAHSLLNKFKTIENVCNAPVEELMTVDGVGKSAALHLKLLPYIARGYSFNSNKDKKRFKSLEEVCQRCIMLQKGNINETAFVLCFDSANRLLKEVKISEGEPGFIAFEPRKVIDAVAFTTTTKVLLCHNHPSGILIPSRSDISATQNIKEVLENIGIELIDHIIVSDNKYVSCKII